MAASKLLHLCPALRRWILSPVQSADPLLIPTLSGEKTGAFTAEQILDSSPGIHGQVGKILLQYDFGRQAYQNGNSVILLMRVLFDSTRIDL